MSLRFIVLRSIALPLGSLATATHLAFDLFPWQWYGYALIHLPLMGRTSATLSILWVIASIVVCLGLAFALIRSRGEANLVLGSWGLSFAISVVREPAFWSPLAALIVLGGVAWVLAFTPFNQQSLFQRRW